jgi:hypothetical protein
MGTRLDPFVEEMVVIERRTCKGMQAVKLGVGARSSAGHAYLLTRWIASVRQTWNVHPSFTVVGHVGLADVVKALTIATDAWI